MKTKNKQIKQNGKKQYATKKQTTTVFQQPKASVKQPEATQATSEDCPNVIENIFSWTPKLPVNAVVPARCLAELINSVKDTVAGTLTVFRLLNDDRSRRFSGHEPYIGDFHTSNLERLAIHSSLALDALSDKYIDYLDELNEGQKS